MFCYFKFCADSIAHSYSYIYELPNGNGTLGEDVVATSDGGVIVAGAALTSALFVKLDATGNVQWSKGSEDLGTNGNGLSIVETPDGHFVAAAVISQQIVVFKLTNTGDLEWGKMLETNVDSYVHRIILTQDGGYALCGFIEIQGEHKGFIAKIDAAGNMVWQKLYGNTGHYDLQFIIETPTGFAAAGVTAALDLWLIQIDDDGNLLSSKAIGGNKLDQANWIHRTQDGSLLVVGRTFSFGEGTPGNPNGWILKLDATGEPLWQKALGGTGYEDANWIDEAENGDLLVLGTEESLGDPAFNRYLLRLDAVGNPQWFRSYGFGLIDLKAATLGDGSFVLTGMTDSFRGPEGDLWVFTVGSDGAIDPSCDFAETNIPTIGNAAGTTQPLNVQVTNTAFPFSDFTFYLDIPLARYDACHRCPTFSFDPPSLPDGTQGVPYSVTVAASGGAPPYTYSLPFDGVLPDGLTLDSETGLISGVPAIAGLQFFQIMARDANGCTTITNYTLNVNCGTFVFSPETLLPGNINEEYSQTITVSGGTPPLTSFISGILPDGLSYDPEQGLISGTPQTAGTFLFDLDVFDASFTCSSAHFYYISISCPEAFLNPPDLPPATTGVPYNQVLTVTGNESLYFFYLANGSLPPGISLAYDTGEISGTPEASGSYAFTVIAMDTASNCAVLQQYTIAVSCGTIEITPESLGSGSTGNTYNQALAAIGGIAPYFFSLDSGTLPSGVLLSSDGVLSGIPTAAGVFQFQVRVNDAAGCSAVRSYAIEILESCLLCDEFDNGSLDTRWSYLKPAWTENGQSLLGTPVHNKAVALTGTAFDGCRICSIETALTFKGSEDGAISVIGWYLDTNNFIEVAANDEKNSWIIRQRSGGNVVAKMKAKKAIHRNILYTTKVDFDGSQFRVFVNDMSTPLLTLSPLAIVNSGQAGFQVKDTVGQFDFLHIE